MPIPTYNEVKNLINGNLANYSDIKPVEHREVEQAILDYAKTSIEEITQNISSRVEVLVEGYIQLSDISDEYPVVGGLNIQSAERLSATRNDTRYKVYFSDNLTGNYFAVLSMESRGSSSGSWDDDNDVIISYKNLESNSIEILLREVGETHQNVRAHVTIVKY